MAKADLLFLNNKAMEACGVLDMREAIKDVEATYVLTEKGDVILPGKLVTRWGTTPDDEIIYFNAVGSGLMDIAVVTRCYRKALKERLGMTFPYWE